jgi:toxin ParE1/3/4
MQIIWTLEALERLAEIEEYISKDSSTRAVKFIDYLIDRGESLCDHPQMGRVVPEIGNGNIREIIAKKYRIIYRISKERIEILTVFEGHRLLKLNELGIN